eukprot:5461637-Prymnesium_polylepis.1
MDCAPVSCVRGCCRLRYGVACAVEEDAFCSWTVVCGNRYQHGRLLIRDHRSQARRKSQAKSGREAGNGAECSHT